MTHSFPLARPLRPARVWRPPPGGSILGNPTSSEPRRPRKIGAILERSVQRNRPVRGAAVLVIAHFGPVEIKISVWLVADLTRECDDRRNLPIKTCTRDRKSTRLNSSH